MVLLYLLHLKEIFWLSRFLLYINFFRTYHHLYLFLYTDYLIFYSNILTIISSISPHVFFFLCFFCPLHSFSFFSFSVSLLDISTACFFCPPDTPLSLSSQAIASPPVSWPSCCGLPAAELPPWGLATIVGEAWQSRQPISSQSATARGCCSGPARLRTTSDDRGCLSEASKQGPAWASLELCSGGDPPPLSLSLSLGSMA